jgi:hypothetical protein
MQLGPFTLNALFRREPRVLPAQQTPVRGAKACPPCSGNCVQGHACPAYRQRAGVIPSRQALP